MLSSRLLRPAVPIALFPSATHNMLCRTKKTSGFSPKFFSVLPLCPGKTCAIMSITDEICEETE